MKSIKDEIDHAITVGKRSEFTENETYPWMYSYFGRPIMKIAFNISFSQTQLNDTQQ